MADIKATKAVKYNDRDNSSLLDRERKRLRTMQIIFALFCIALILSMLLTQVLKP